MSTLEELPNELKAIIFRTDDPKELLNYCHINTQFNQLCRSDIFWRDLVFNKFGNVDKLCNSWYETYLYHYKYSKAYILTSLSEGESRILGSFGEKILAFDYIIKDIIKYPETIENTEFMDIFLQDNPNNDAYNVLLKLRRKDVRMINLVKDLLVSYLQDIEAPDDNLFTYVVKDDPYTEYQILVSNIIRK